MAKYKVEVGSFCTRLVQRKITVSAKSEEEAAAKAIDKYKMLEADVAASVDCGEPQVDFIDAIN